MNHGLNRYKNGPDEQGRRRKGCRCGTCKKANRAYENNRTRMIAYGRWEPLVDAAGTRRRLQALMRAGWSPRLLAVRLGCSREVLRVRLHDRQWVTAATAESVRVLCARLWLQPPPQGTPHERRAATMARKYAREHGFVPLAAWDEIDDPAASPVPGWDVETRPARQPAASPLVAAAIRKARQRAEMTQCALAEAVGVTAQYIQLLEYGKRSPGEQTWVQLELTLGPLGVVRDAGTGTEAATEESDAA